MTLGLILKPLASGSLFFFDVRVFNSFAETNHSHVKLEHFGDIKVISVGLMRSVSGKWNIEVLCHLSSGGMGKAASIAYKCLASLLSEKWNFPYPLIMGWLHCFLGYSLLRYSLMCLRGSRSRSSSPGVPSAVDLVVAEGHLATNDV